MSAAWSIPSSLRLQSIAIFFATALLSGPIFPTSAQADEPRHPCLETLDRHPITSIIRSRPFTLSVTPPQGAPLSLTLAGLVQEMLATVELEQRRHQMISEFGADASPATSDQRTLLAFVDNRAKKDRNNRLSAFLARRHDLAGTQNASLLAPLPLLQERLLAAGLARLSTEGINEACASHLHHLEADARQQQTGLWKLPIYSVKNASNLHLSAIVSTYQVVRGKIASVTRNPKGTSYINFGRHWNSDFTITLGKKSLAAWEGEDKFLDDLIGRTIYVRGWIEKKGGPLIRISAPGQMWFAAESE